MTGKITDDCRYGACRNCGVCEFDGRTSTLTSQSGDKDIRPKLVFPQRDQEGDQPPYSVEKPDLTIKEAHFRLWFEKTGPAAYLSQLELQAVFERAFRRAGLPMAFSAGFHPMPRLSFGKALPVGVSSTAEWINVFLRQDFEAAEVVKRLIPVMPEGLRPLKADRLTMGKKQPQSVEEVFELHLLADAEKWIAAWESFMARDELLIDKRTKKGKPKQVNIRPIIKEMQTDGDLLTLVFDWRNQYMSPLTLCLNVMEGATQLDFTLTKTAQRFDA